MAGTWSEMSGIYDVLTRYLVPTKVYYKPRLRVFTTLAPVVGTYTFFFFFFSNKKRSFNRVRTFWEKDFAIACW